MRFSDTSIKTTNIDTKRREELEEENPLFEQRLDNALDGLEPYYLDHLKNRISKANALTIADYILSIKVETNISTNHRKGIITSLKLASRYLDNKPFEEMTREDVLTFLDSIRKSEISDPTHKWIGTYNLYRVCLSKTRRSLIYTSISKDTAKVSEEYSANHNMS